MDKDLLATTDFERHYKFYFALVVGLGFTYVTWTILLNCNFLFFQNILYSDKTMALVFIVLSLINNIYQVVAHIFTGTKIMGYKKIAPPGSADNQTLMVFTVSNIFDILGWITIFIQYGYADPFLALLAATHFGSGIVSIIFSKTFQTYFIENPVSTVGDSFGYLSWRIFRICFVFTDAIARGYSSFLLFRR